MEQNPDAERPSYEEIAAKIRSDIASGVLRPGDRLPAGRSLASQYGVALMTVQNAYRLLGDEGLVVSQQGRGTFVRDPAKLAGKQEGGGQAFGALAAELSAIHQTLQQLGARVDRLEQLLGDSGPRPSQ